MFWLLILSKSGRGDLPPAPLAPLVPPALASIKLQVHEGPHCCDRPYLHRYRFCLTLLFWQETLVSTSDYQILNLLEEKKMVIRQSRMLLREKILTEILDEFQFSAPLTTT